MPVEPAGSTRSSTPTTIVKQGEMLGVVVNTGMNTDFSSVVALVEDASWIAQLLPADGEYRSAASDRSITVLAITLIALVALFRHQPMLKRSCAFGAGGGSDPGQRAGGAVGDDGGRRRSISPATKAYRPRGSPP